ncbi:hypothetical protein L6R52_15670 [Myxococcota bacterium]|nr:hypothetical protein [Myxococcota bacterium]
MSSRVYVDGRVVQLGNCESIINQALSDLRARRSNISCGRAEVVTSNVGVDAQTRVFNEARYQDKMEVKDTRGLQDRLNAPVADYSSSVLPDWKPVRGTSIDVDAGIPAGKGMRLVEDFECDALKVEDEVTGVHSARMMIFEVTDGLGNTSYQLGLDSLLFDDDMEWKDPANKAAYETFLEGVLRAQKHALKDADAGAGAGKGLAAKLARADLKAGKSEKIPGGTHSIYAKPPAAGSETKGLMSRGAGVKPQES